MARNYALFMVPILLILLGSGFSSAAYIHMVSYRTDIQPKPNQDFTLFITFKNDYADSVDNSQIRLLCPQGFTCPNSTATFPSYGVEELGFPIRSDATAGLYSIKVMWDDGSFLYTYNQTTQNTSSTMQVYSATIPLDIREYSLSTVSAKPSLFTNENGSYWVEFNATNLNNVQVSLYSNCIAFSDPLFHFDRLDSATTLQTPALVNCRTGNAEIIFSLQSDEVSYEVPLTVEIDKRPHAQIFIAPESNTSIVGKDYYRVNVTNTGSTAEALTLSVVSNPAVSAADVEYLGDFTGTREVVFQIQSDQAGTYPLSIEAAWTEDNEQFSQVFVNPVTLQGNWFWWLLAIILVIVAFVALRIRK